MKQYVIIFSKKETSQEYLYTSTGGPGRITIENCEEMGNSHCKTKNNSIIANRIKIKQQQCNNYVSKPS